MAFDGIVTKAIASELQQLSGAKIDKIFQPDKNHIILGLYLNGKNYALNLCTTSGNYRIHLTTHPKPNPIVAPNFCMVLRKHLIGLSIKNILTDALERIVTIELEGFDDIDDIITNKIVIELMGKHCNVILLDSNNVIIDSLRHINGENIIHPVIPHIKYQYQSTTKINFLECSTFEEFTNNISCKNIEDLALCISQTFNGISKNLIQFIIDSSNSTNLTDTLQHIYKYLTKIVFNTDTLNLKFETLYKEEKEYDYILIPSNEIKEPFSLNFFIDDFYFKKETSEDFRAYRDNLLKLILITLKKYKKRFSNIDDKLIECENLDIYRLYGELITANLYRISNNKISEIKLENYYDDNKILTISLDSKYTPAENAKRFFKKYNKLKNTLEIVTQQKQETISEINYIESVIYELEACSTIEEVNEIYDEISSNEIFQDKPIKNKSKKIKKSNLTKNKNVTFNPIKYNIDGYTLLVGRNNKENDYLTLKYAKKTDLWFHTKDVHGSHAILVLENNQKPSDDILVKCAQIVVKHSKAKYSSNTPVDYCEVKFVKKPKGAKPGMVIYTNQKTLIG